MTTVQTLNYPSATAEEWNTAGRIVRAHLMRSGYDLERAEEVAQAWTVEEVDRPYHRRKRCPINPRVAAVWAVRQARKHGNGTLTRAEKRGCERRRLGLAEPQPMTDALPVMDARRSSLDPATLAEAGEALAERCPAFARRAREQGTTPSDLALQAAGWGLDDEDTARLALVTSEGAGYAPPAEGCKGLHSTDPRDTRAETSRRVANDWRRVAGLPPI